MILFDVTDASRWRHRSGLARVGARVRQELGAAALPVRWRNGGPRGADPLASAGPGDWFLTPELFSEKERPGLSAFLGEGGGPGRGGEGPGGGHAGRRCRTAAIYHDAIPLTMPAVTWPASVARHPFYMGLLARFDLVWAVSAASRVELLGFWAWQGRDPGDLPEVRVLPLGADFDGGDRVRSDQAGGPAWSNATSGASDVRGAGGREAVARLVCVGIIEPRKDQELLLDVCEGLWEEGLRFELHLVGRVNPLFGRETGRRIRRLSRSRPGLHHHADMDDAGLRRLCAGALAMVLPSRAEGCGLPLVEALWLGVPCVCSDAPSLAENAAGGGCLVVPRGDRASWASALRGLLLEPGMRARLAAQARERPLPTWARAGALLREALAADNRAGGGTGRPATEG